MRSTAEFRGRTKQSASRIVDEFSALPVSKQRKWQLRKLTAGKCLRCGAPLATATHCLKHAIKRREHERKKRGFTRRRLLYAISYQLEEKARRKKARKVRKSKPVLRFSPAVRDAQDPKHIFVNKVRNVVRK